MTLSIKDNNQLINKKCAPNKIYKDGSCMTIESLIKIAQKWNIKNNDKINIINNKQYLVNELDTKLQNKCSNQICWLRLDFIKELEDNEDLLNNTFRPLGPKGKYDWLSTTDIDNVITQYQEKYPEFLFLGAVPYDFEDLKFLGLHNLDFKKLEDENIHKIGIVINLDEHYKGGSHWVALFANLSTNQIYFFDSVGKKPRKRIKKFINKIIKYLYYKKYNKKLYIQSIYKKLKNHNNLSNSDHKHSINTNIEIQNLLNDFDIRYNNIQHQFKDSECGVYSINFITRLVSDESFDNVINNIITDEQMNNFRKEYFININ
jgi:hypothetical protein